MAKEVKNVTLYVRGANKSTRELGDIWDDTGLDQAYDHARSLFSEQIAKRIAMDTNSKQPGSDKKADKVKPKSSSEWKEGMPCRAIYEEDGLEYEASIVHIFDDDCIVKFIGYDNEETVPISSLKRTLGDEARIQQVEEADTEDATTRADDGFESESVSEGVDLHNDESFTKRIAADQAKNKKKKSNKKKTRASAPNYGGLPNLPMPNINMFRNIEEHDTPIPPPPPLLGGRSEAEEQALSDMLLSWYMTGYYTGLYQGINKQRSSRRNH